MANSNPNAHWYALYIKSRKEFKVEKALIEKKIETYLPLKKSIRRWADRKKTILTPLLPSYIFVKILKPQITETLKTDDVVKFVSFENKPVIIPEVQILAVKRYIKYGFHIAESSEKLQKGKKVEIISGSLKGLRGIMINFEGKHRIQVELTGVGKNIYLKIPANQVKEIK